MADKPSPYDPEALERLCDLLAGGMSMDEACRLPDCPVSSTVYRAMAKDETVARAIARAREAQQHALVDEMVIMSDKATPENWQVVKMQIWARQWRAAKLAPKTYGDKQAIEHTGPNGGPVTSVTLPADPVEAARIYQQIVGGG